VKRRFVIGPRMARPGAGVQIEHGVSRLVAL
jgi:hypothetical protein